MTEPATELDIAVIEHFVQTIMDGVPPRGGESEHDRALRRKVARLALLDAKPANTMQALLAAHAITMHFAAMDALRRAAPPDVPDAVAARHRSNAATLSRTMQTALRKLHDLQAPPKEPTVRKSATRPQAEPPRAEAEPAIPVRKARFPRSPWQSPAKLWDQMTMEERREAFGYRYDPVTDSVPPLDTETNKPA